ncbi:MAG TPA: 2,3-bisphosphoglycerate-independent phosphoglycerate mutase [Candidatus Limnocylindria bacterium]|nr:2,3-bisphosphoglycerate-independent phosphoglycerate mutase [Candidatus Limnocylindria bacterium]
MKQPIILVICDGWGESTETHGNAIAEAKTPHLDALMAEWPHTTVEASGKAVGLPAGQIGNSEVGHLTIGAGRVIHQGLSKQHQAIETGEFYQNTVLVTAIERAIERGTSLHVVGLVSPGGVHSHHTGALAVARLAKRLGLKDRVHVHAFTDGRDVSPSSALEQIAEFEAELAAIGTGRIASISGRYFAMDRDNRWERVQQAYEVLVGEAHPHTTQATEYIRERYAAGETDEFLRPIAIADTPEDRTRIEDGDVVVFFNFRADRARQLSHALADKDFDPFPRSRVLKDVHFVSFTEYDPELDIAVAFPNKRVEQTLAEVVSTQGLKQFHLAETEKYAHVAYFLNGGNETAFAGEDRELIPSLKVATYDLSPAMSSAAVTDSAIARLQSKKYELIVVNLANADMVGHTGNHDATVKAIEFLDSCLGRLTTAAAGHGYALLMTADHGNAERNIDAASDKPLTAHTTNPVPVLLCNFQASPLRSGGGLQDIAPTVLTIMGLPIPAAMTGRSLL